MSKISTLIFDFGDVFINLDKNGAMENALELFQLDTFEDEMIETNILYEVGKISTLEFLGFYTSKFPRLSETQIIDAWNFIIRDFPTHRLQFIKKLSEQKIYKLILLSNTNSLHINYIKNNVLFYNEFKRCFNAFYLSHEIQLRKPSKDIFEFVLKKNNLISEECLFIDDTLENTQAAEKLGFKTWNIDETNEDVINLFEIKKDFF